MASTTKEKKTARTYYKKHKKYREEKIAETLKIYSSRKKDCTDT